MIALRFEGTPAIVRGIDAACRSAAGPLGAVLWHTSSLDPGPDVAGTWWQSTELVVSTPLSVEEAEKLRTARAGGLRWLVLSSQPTWEELVLQASLGADDYLLAPCRDRVRLHQALTRSDASAAALASGSLEVLFSLFDGDVPTDAAGWQRQLGRMAMVLEAELSGLLLPGTPPMQFAREPHSSATLKETLLLPVPLGRQGHGRLLLGRTRNRSRPLYTHRAYAIAMTRLLSQQLQRADLHARILGAKQEWEATVDTIQDPIVMLDPSGRVIRANVAFAELVKRPIRAVVEQHVDTLCGLVAANSWWQVKERTGEEAAAAIAFPIDPDRHFEAHPMALNQGREGSIVYLRDVTEAHRLTAMMMQRERFAALGELADGIFHDLNNLATSLQPELVCACQSLPPIRAALAEKAREGHLSPDVEEDMSILSEALEAATAATRRLEQVLNNLRQYSWLRQRSTGETTSIDLNRLLHALPVLFNSRARQKGIRIQLETGDIPQVAGQTSDLMRIFENLLKNALDAMDRGGRIDVSTTRQGDRVRIEVRDNGPGIPRELQTRIFERGFTTRQAQGGTGLGLFLCRQLLETHGGTLRVESAAGEGARFIAELAVWGTPAS